MARDHRYFVYLLASKPYGTLYVGVTGNLPGRMAEHRDDLRDGFTKRYGVHHLVWFEEFADIHAAIRREKQIKKWNRAWKIALIAERTRSGMICLCSLSDEEVGFPLSRE